MSKMNEKYQRWRTAVRRSQLLTSDAKVLLWELTDWADNDDGTCWPCFGTLSLATGIDVGKRRGDGERRFPRISKAVAIICDLGCAAHDRNFNERRKTIDWTFTVFYPQDVSQISPRIEEWTNEARTYVAAHSRTRKLVSLQRQGSISLSALTSGSAEDSSIRVNEGMIVAEGDSLLDGIPRIRACDFDSESYSSSSGGFSIQSGNQTENPQLFDPQDEVRIHHGA